MARIWQGSKPWPHNWVRGGTGHVATVSDPLPFDHRPDDIEALMFLLQQEIPGHAHKSKGYFAPDAIVEYARREE